MNNGKNILICPLEWGLGHAGRMIPIALTLRQMGNNIFIASGKEHIEFFRKELSGATFIDFPGFRPRYSRFLPQYLALLLKMPILFCSIIAEHIRLRGIISNNRIDIVISDNRFGLWNNKVKTVYITHQPVIPFPLKFRSFERAGTRFHRFFIRKYSFCFIPDLPGKLNISGRLSHDTELPSNARYIGILSRFNAIEQQGAEEVQVPAHNTLILSGPEPQKGLLRKKITEIMKDNELPLVVLEGRPGNNTGMTTRDNIISFGHLSSPGMKKVILESNRIIARSGYSTIMELISLNRSALLIPTPGQTEQEYLAGSLSAKGWFATINQKKLNRSLILAEGHDIPCEEIISASNELLLEALNELLKE